MNTKWNASSVETRSEGSSGGDAGLYLALALVAIAIGVSGAIATMLGAM